MNNSLVRCIWFCMCLVFVAVSANAQDDTITAAGEKYVISAKAGGVNFVEGTVGVVRKKGTSGLLIKGDKLEIGDRVSTSADGKAEILLNPGSFLRLGGNSVFEFKTTSLDDLQILVDSGSAILEVFAAEDFKVGIATPKAKYLIVQTGVYRIDVARSESRIEVWKGMAYVSGTATELKGGRAAVSTSVDQVSIAKFDRDEMDSLDAWSKLRGKELAKVTARLKDRQIRTALMRSFLGRGWNVFGSFGLWVFDPFYGGYVFLPFGRGWSSPYGYGYACYLGWYDLPPVIWYPPYIPPPTSGNPGNPQVTPIVSQGTRDPIPPFVRMGDAMGVGRGGGRSDSGGGFDSGGSYSGSSSSSGSSQTYSSPPTKSDPPPTKSDPPPTKQP